MSAARCRPWMRRNWSARSWMSARRDRQPLLFRGMHGQLLAHQLFDQSLELPGEFQGSDEIIGVDDFIVDAHNPGHTVSSAQAPYAWDFLAGDLFHRFSPA